ncbi:MAG: CAP domain-containing protein [Candidatus Paceibacterota bacterium]|jgi:hypothetical protein
MKKFLEKIVHTIIPHKKNGNIPHILQEEFVIVLIIFIGTLFYFNQNNFNLLKNLNLTATVYPAVLADLTNQDRVNSGVSRLAWNTTLEKAAKMKAEDMVQNGYFAHTSPSGVTPWFWLKETNYNFIYAGENLAIDFTESVNVENAWLNSPKHRENVLNSNFTEIGIATAEGIFEGKNTTFIVEFFGSPSMDKIEEIPVIKKEVVIGKIDKIVTPSVAGASTENSAEENNIKIIESTEELIIIKNKNVQENIISTIPSDTEIKPMSTWYERFIVSPINVILIIYKIILGLILISTLLLLSKRYQKHHAKHLVMSAILIILVTILLIFVSAK